MDSGQHLTRGEDGFSEYLESHYFPRARISLFALGALLIAVVLSYTLWQIQPHFKWAVWLVLTSSLIALSFLSKLHFSSNSLPPDRGQKQRLGLVISLDVAFGLMWVIAVFMWGGQGPQTSSMLVTVLLFGSALSSAVNLHSFKLSSVATIGLALPALGVTFLTENTLLASLCFILWIGVLGLAWGLNKAFIARRFLIFEKEILLQNIEDKMRELDQLRLKEASSRKEAEAANQAKSRFLAHSSHDLRQPLHAMGLLLETIPEKGLNKRAGQIISRVKLSLDSLSGLFDSLLDVALLDTGQVEVNNTAFPVDEVLNQITQDYRELARNQNVKLKYVPTKLFIETDRVILHRMVQNLVSNAIKNSSGKGVLVGVRRRQENFAIVVYDSGIGISKENQARIFEEFTKIDDAKSDDVIPGLGLGLSIVQRLAHLIDARISIKSRLGEGSLFAIEGLKRAAKAKAKPDLKSSRITNTSLADIRIFIIDDDSEVLTVSRKIIEKWGFTVESYTKYAGKTLNRPDIILCDYQLGGTLTGLDVIKDIRGAFKANIPAILITGNTSADVSKQAKADDLPILYKPVKPAQLRSLLLTLLPETRS